MAKCIIDNNGIILDFVSDANDFIYIEDDHSYSIGDVVDLSYNEEMARGIDAEKAISESVKYLLHICGIIVEDLLDSSNANEFYSIMKDRYVNNPTEGNKIIELKERAKKEK